MERLDGGGGRWPAGAAGRPPAGLQGRWPGAGRAPGRPHGEARRNRGAAEAAGRRREVNSAETGRVWAADSGYFCAKIWAGRLTASIRQALVSGERR
jgi:hypothetical protein